MRTKALAEGKEDQTFFYVTELPGRGKSAVASQQIPAGEILIEEMPLLSFDFTGEAVHDVLNVAWCYHRLAQADKDSVMDLCQLMEDSGGLMTALEVCPPKASELPPSMTIEQLRRVASIVDCNLFRIVILSSLPEVWGAELGDVSCALYRTCSRFNHSCDPNLGRKYEANGRMSLHTLRCVEAGEELTTSYLGDAELLQSTERRRWQLTPYGFRCSCPRCEDPVRDAARVFSCTSCGNGLVLAGCRSDELSGRACESCAADMSAICAASSLASEQSAFIAFEVGRAALEAAVLSSSHGGGGEPTNLSGSLVRLEEKIAQVETHLAPEHWAMAALHDTAQQMCKESGQLFRAVPHLESKLRFLSSPVAPAQPLPLRLPAWDRDACQDLLEKAQREATMQGEQHSHGRA